MAVSLSFWAVLDAFTEFIKNDIDNCDVIPTSVHFDDKETDKLVISGCERITLEVLAAITAGQDPIIRVPCPQPSDGKESLVTFGRLRSTRRFCQLMHTVGQVSHLVTMGTYATKRDVYYEDVALYQSQSNFDRSVEDVARVLKVPRQALHLTTTSKGLIAGSLSYITQDDTKVEVLHAQNGLLVPECVWGLKEIVSDARYVLVIEKDATFQKLLDAQFHRSYGPVILVTGKGYPDVTTRQFVFRLWHDLKIPVLALTDADPYGLHIAAVYKFGALARDEAGLAVPNLAWLGVLPVDLRTLQIPANALLPLTPKDHGKLASLAAHPAISKDKAWLKQIHEQQEMGYKAEIQSLTHIAPDYLTQYYIPTKLQHGGWI